MADFDIAYALAADLAGSRVDANEAQKTLSYLRSKRDGRALFTYLRTIEDNGSAVVRSRQTMDYYRNLRSACERHLRDLQDDYPRLVQTYAWSLRLLRYYRTVPDATLESSNVARPGIRSTRSDNRDAILSPTSTPEAQLASSGVPSIGDTFGGEVLAIDKMGIRVKVKNLPEDQAIAIIKKEQLGDKQYQVGNIARIEVIDERTLESGLVVLGCKPAPKAPKKKK